MAISSWSRVLDIRFLTPRHYIPDFRETNWNLINHCYFCLFIFWLPTISLSILDMFLPPSSCLLLNTIRRVLLHVHKTFISKVVMAWVQRCRRRVYIEKLDLSELPVSEERPHDPILFCIALRSQLCFVMLIVENWEFYAMVGGWGADSLSLVKNSRWQMKYYHFKPVCDWTIIQDGRWKITRPGWIKWINLIGQNQT